MNYKLIILNAYIEHREQKTSYQSYFKREAQIAKRDNFVEFSDYFDGCQHIIKSYKNEIEKQYNNRLTEDDRVVASVKSGRGIRFGDEVVTDESDRRIQDSLESIAKQKEFVQNRGYKNNLDYTCYLKETGEIANEIWWNNNERKLYWQDIVEIEHGVNTAKDELFIQDQKNKESKIELPEKNKKNSEHEIKILTDYLNFKNKNVVIKKIKGLDRNKPKNIFIILKALYDGGLLLMNDNNTIYEAYYNEFGYHKDFETLKRGLNYYDFEKPAKNLVQKIENMTSFLTD